MASQFAPIARLKKEHLERLRRQMAQIQGEIMRIEQEITESKTALLNHAKPTHGEMRLFAQYALMTQSYHTRINQAKTTLHRVMKEHNALQMKVNAALIEFEKFKYLQTQEEHLFRKKLKKQEALFMDEVAVMGYNMQQGVGQ